MPDNLAHSLRNEPVGADAATVFDDRVEKLIAAVNAWAKDVPAISTEEQASRCADLIDQVAKEDGAIEDARKAAVKPFDDERKKIHTSFMDRRGKLGVCLPILKRLKEGWLRLVEQRQAEARRKAEEAALAARREVEEAVRKLKEAKGPAVQSQLEADLAQQRAQEAADAARRAARARPQVVGEMSGRASGFRMHYSAKIVDRRKVLDWYQGHPDVLSVIQRLADAEARDLKDRFAVPGAQLVKERRV
jgi:hypothetical protein